jgi:hypothetical protein
MMNSTQDKPGTSTTIRNATSVERLSEQQAVMFQHFDERLNQLSEQLGTTSQPHGKDLWDRLATLAPMISAAIIAITGAYFTYTYNQQQLKVQEIQTIEKFFPHLVGDEKSKRAAILAINSLGNAALAAKVASIFASPGTASALSSMANNTRAEDKAAVREALLKTLTELYGAEAVKDARKAQLEQSAAAETTPPAEQSAGSGNEAPHAVSPAGEKVLTDRPAGSRGTADGAAGSASAASSDEQKMEKSAGARAGQPASTQDNSSLAESQRVGMEAGHPEKIDQRTDAHAAVE